MARTIIQLSKKFCKRRTNLQIFMTLAGLVTW